MALSKTESSCKRGVVKPYGIVDYQQGRSNLLDLTEVGASLGPAKLKKSVRARAWRNQVMVSASGIIWGTRQREYRHLQQFHLRAKEDPKGQGQASQSILALK